MLIDLLFPRHCYLCDQIVGTDGLCAKCWTNIKIISEPKCEKCSFEFAMNVTGLCAKCMKTKSYIDKVISIMRYDNMTKALIMKFKNFGYTEIVDLFIPSIKNILKDERIDYIIPVPLHWLRHIWRGYNQAAMIGQAISREMQIKYLPDGLIRKKFTQSNTGSTKERKEKVANAFESRFVFQGTNILLVDDVYTTGSTLEACAKALKSVGAGSILGLSLCKR